MPDPFTVYTISSDYSERPMTSSQPPSLPDELVYLVASFLPSEPADSRSKAFLILSSYCQGVRSTEKDPSDGTAKLQRTFSRLIVPRIGDTDEQILLSGVTFITALFEVDSAPATGLFQEDGVAQVILDSVDIAPSPDLALSVALLLSQACAHKSCRAVLPAEAIIWLEEQSRQSKSSSLHVAASVALLKLARGSSDDAAATATEAQSPVTLQEEKLALSMVDIVLSSTNGASLGESIEALAYLSTNPDVKELLSKREPFLRKLFALAPRRKSVSPAASTLYYGLLVIATNMCAYKPKLSEEQSHIDKIRRMAKPSKDAQDPGSPLQTDEAVRSRCRRLVAAGVLDIFPAAATDTTSDGIKVITSKALLSIVEDTANRGKVLQSGGARALVSIIRHSIPPSNALTQVIPLESIQALAKLSITASPVQVFGPNEAVMYDAIRPFSLMVQHSSANLLQRFEAVMALTNLSSHSPEVASRVASADGLMNRVELLLLEEHDLVRRASMELICNLIAGSDTVFRRYSAQDGPGSSKIQILLAMSDVEDLQTRLAASGALATVTSVPEACQEVLAMQKERHHALEIIAQLIDASLDDNQSLGDPGLVHRGVVIVRNLCSLQEKVDLDVIREEGKVAGLIEALAKLVKAKAVDQSVLVPAIESLTLLLKK